MRKEITFDSFIRGALIVAGVTAAILLINRLSAVLLPFVVAWLIAYLIYPIVIFFEKRCRLKVRTLSIVVTLAFLLLAIIGFFELIVPPMIEQGVRLKDIIMNYIHSENNQLPAQIEQYIRDFLASKDFQRILGGINYMAVLQTTVSQVVNIVSNAASIVIGIFSAAIILLYLFFILLDYEKISEGWIKLIPNKQRKFAHRISQDVMYRMNCYFRGQSLIALCVGILFAIGFSIIQLPMAIALGLFIGFLNLVPYLQIIGFIPAILLALLKAADTGQSLWIILLLVGVVFLVVQSIQDLVLTPKIMGKMMGLNPAIILLSLSIWGSLLGFIGLIIALPLTTIIVAYYQAWLDRVQRREAEENQ